MEDKMNGRESGTIAPMAAQQGSHVEAAFAQAQPPALQPSTGRARTARPRTARAKSDSISAGLRKLWAEVENEPVPDDFLDMLDSIDAALDRKSGRPGT